MAEKGKGKAQESDDWLHETAPSRQMSSTVDIGPIPSPPTSPVQGARLPMNRRLPVRPTAVLQSTPPVAGGTTSPTESARPLQTYTPCTRPQDVLDTMPGPPHQVVRTIGSTESIAESMIKGFEYDPNDRTPPKRRMKTVADAVKCAIDGCDPTATSPQSTAPERQNANQEPHQPGQQVSIETGESSKSSVVLESPTPYIPASTNRLAEIEANLAETQIALQAAYDSVDAVYDPTALDTGDRPSVDEGDGEGWDTGPAASFFKSDAQRRFEERRPLTMLSEHTEVSESSEDSDRREDGPVPIFGMAHSNTSALNIAEWGVGLGQTTMRRGVYSADPNSQDPFVDGVGVREARPSSVAAGSFSPAGDNRDPCANGINMRQQPYALPTPPVPAARGRISGSFVGLSPVREVDSSRDSLSTPLDGSSFVPMRTENEKPPSSSPFAVSSPSVSFLAASWISKCGSFVGYAVAWLTPLAFLAAALRNLAFTRTFDGIPSGLFTAESQTLQSENWSSKLTMAWIDGHAIRFNVSAIVNWTSKPTEVVPNHWTFLLDWRADAAMLDANGTAAVARVSAMPLPSFGEELVRGMGFLGLFAGIFWIVSFAFRFVGRCWHWREDGNVFWTRFLLRWFDKGRVWIGITVAAVSSALVWSVASRALLSASF